MLSKSSSIVVSQYRYIYQHAWFIAAAMSKSHELKTILPTYKDYTTNYAQIEPQTSSERDSAILARLGKKQVLKVNKYPYSTITGAVQSFT